MAQTGYTPILIYSSSTTSNAPAAGSLTNSTLGSELAINITDGKLFYKDNANNVQVIAWKTTPTTAGGTGLTSYTAGDMLYYASGTTLTKLAIGTTGRWLGSSGTAPQWNSPAALTKTDDTNVTLTLGGSASTALLNAASLTLGWTGQLAVTRGGTGLSTVAQGDILYGSASNTLAALAKNTSATRYLSNTGSSNNPAWAQVDLTNGVTGTLPVGNGGTGTSTAFTAGSVVFAGTSGVYAQNNSNFNWDNTNGRLGLGMTGGTRRLNISFIAADGGIYCETSNNNATYIALLRSATVLVSHKITGSSYEIINDTGGVSLAAGGTSWAAISDERLKEIIEPINNATEKISTLRTVIGKYKTDSEKTRRVFLIAQDVKSVLPEAINVEEDEMQTLSLRYTDLIPLMIAAIKEQQNSIKKLEEKIKIVEEKL